MYKDIQLCSVGNGYKISYRQKVPKDGAGLYDEPYTECKEEVFKDGDHDTVMKRFMELSGKAELNKPKKE